jgi:hypothetical protein
MKAWVDERLTSVPDREPLDVDLVTVACFPEPPFFDGLSSACTLAAPEPAHSRLDVQDQQVDTTDQKVDTTDQKVGDTGDEVDGKDEVTILESVRFSETHFSDNSSKETPLQRSAEEVESPQAQASPQNGNTSACPTLVDEGCFTTGYPAIPEDKVLPSDQLPVNINPPATDVAHTPRHGRGKSVLGWNGSDWRCYLPTPPIRISNRRYHRVAQKVWESTLQLQV